MAHLRWWWEMLAAIKCITLCSVECWNHWNHQAFHQSTLWWSDGKLMRKEVGLRVWCETLQSAFPCCNSCLLFLHRRGEKVWLIELVHTHTHTHTHRVSFALFRVWLSEVGYYSIFPIDSLYQGAVTNSVIFDLCSTPLVCCVYFA